MSLSFQLRNEESLAKMQATFDLITSQLKELPSLQQALALLESSFEAKLTSLGKDIVQKADKKGTLQNLELLNDALSSLSKEMIMKAGIQDLLTLIDKKCDKEELSMEVALVKEGLAQNAKELRDTLEEQTSLNEVLCAENCVARWLWKNGRVRNHTQGGGGGGILME